MKRIGILLSMYFWRAHKISLRKTVKYKGVEVVYSQRGGGETLVLLHGFLEERGMWNNYAEAFASKLNVIVIDLLGQGESGCLGYVHSMNDHAQAVSAVLDAEEVEKFHVIGHSMGGYVALELANMFPEKINSLTLFHSTAYADSDERKKDRERVIGLAQRNKEVYIKTVIPSLFAEETRKMLQSEISELIETAIGFTEQGIMANIRGMMERPSLQHVLQNASFPKLIVHGSLDPVIKTEDIQALAKLNENVSLAQINGIGHMGHLEAPEKCLKTLMDFCKN